MFFSRSVPRLFDQNTFQNTSEVNWWAVRRSSDRTSRLLGTKTGRKHAHAALRILNVAAVFLEFLYRIVLQQLAAIFLRLDFLCILTAIRFWYLPHIFTWRKEKIFLAVSLPSLRDEKTFFLVYITATDLKAVVLMLHVALLPACLRRESCNSIPSFDTNFFIHLMEELNPQFLLIERNHRRRNFKCWASEKSFYVAEHWCGMK